MDIQTHILIIGLVVFFLVLAPASAAASEQDSYTSAGALYSKSVDLANEGKYKEALKASDEALAFNASSLTHLIQANRAGILVMLGRYDEAITAADAALSVSGNLTTTRSIAYYNKGDALRHLGRTDEARDMFKKAQELDSSLVPPDLSVPVTPAAPATTKSPLSPFAAIAAILGACAACLGFRSKI
ncbi:MAG: tetratricopeptide repeat protein [Methanoregula sp.]|nr:MAG: tetratricopeptide repeat protein [Methanoregula sp.]